MSKDSMSLSPGKRIFFKDKPHIIKASLSLDTVLIYSEDNPQEVISAKLAEIKPIPLH